MVRQAARLTLIAVALAASSATAETPDACAPIFAHTSVALTAGHCDLEAARAELQQNLTPACRDAALSDHVPATERALEQQLIWDEKSACFDERRQLAAWAICTLRASTEAIVKLSYVQPLDAVTRATCDIAFIELGPLVPETGGFRIELSSSRSFDVKTITDARVLGAVLGALERTLTSRRQSARALTSIAAQLCKRKHDVAIDAACAHFVATAQRIEREDHPPLTVAQKDQLGWRIAASLFSAGAATGMASGIALTRNEGHGLAWLTATHTMLAATTIPIIAYRSGAAGGRFTSILWLYVGIPAFVAGGLTAGYFAAQSPTGRIIAGSVSSILSLAIAQVQIWHAF